jgi:hypothetical protein
MNTAIQTILTTPIEYDVTEEGLSKIESRWETVPDCHERENYELVRKGVSEIVGLRGDVERRRKELKKDALEYGRNIDAAAKKIVSRLSAVETRLKTAKGEIDEEKRIEKERKKEEERQRLAELEIKVQLVRNMAAIRIDDTSDTLRSRAVVAEQMHIDEAEYQDLTGQAVAAQMDVIGLLNDAADKMAAREKREAEERAELERQREAQRIEAERLKKLDEERQKRERLEAEKHAAEKARLAEERAAIEAERQKAAAEQAERDRVEKERQAADRAKLEEERWKAKEEQEERARQLQEAEQQRRQEEDARLALERAKMEAERQRIAEEQAQIDEENRRREEERQAKEQAAKEEEERRENEALQAERLDELTAAISKVIAGKVSSASAIAKAIIAGEIPHVKYVG